MYNSSIEKLFVYPIKSLGGVCVEKLQFSPLGVVDDRRYMLVNGKGQFITQRSHSVLSQFSLCKEESGWQVTAPNGQTIVIADQQSSDRLIQTKVWKTELQGREKSTEVSRWFSDQLDELVFLIELDDIASRYCHYQGHTVPFAFADGYPLLVTNNSSLLQLNAQLDVNLAMQRFRPNIVIDVPAQQEYQIAALQFEGQSEVLFAEPCVRCNVPAIDPCTSVYQKNVHQAMKPLLMQESGVVFGMNAIAVNTQTLVRGQQFNYQLVNH